MSNSIRGANICFTGAVEGFTRAELQQLADEYGFNFQERVTKQTDILVKGEGYGQTKILAAEKNGVKIWSAEDFIVMISQDEADGIMTPKHKVKPENEEARRSFYEATQDAGIF